MQLLLGWRLPGDEECLICYDLTCAPKLFTSKTIQLRGKKLFDIYCQKHKPSSYNVMHNEQLVSAVTLKEMMVKKQSVVDILLTPHIQVSSSKKSTEEMYNINGLMTI